jgi:hypothetical protein
MSGSPPPCRIILPPPFPSSIPKEHRFNGSFGFSGDVPAAKTDARPFLFCTKHRFPRRETGDAKGEKATQPRFWNGAVPVTGLSQKHSDIRFHTRRRCYHHCHSLTDTPSVTIAVSAPAGPFTTTANSVNQTKPTTRDVPENMMASWRRLLLLALFVPSKTFYISTKKSSKLKQKHILIIAIYSLVYLSYFLK